MFKKFLSLSSVTFPTAVAAVLLVLCDPKKPAAAVQTAANAMENRKVFEQEGYRNDLRLLGARRAKQIVPMKRAIAVKDFCLAVVPKEDRIQLVENWIQPPDARHVLLTGRRKSRFLGERTGLLSQEKNLQDTFNAH
jgi:hypothetical protein